VTAEDAVNQLHPYGKRDWEHTMAAAAEIAELVRYLNRATLDGPAAAIPDPSTAASVIDSLRTALVRLPQLLDQLGSRMTAFRDHPNLATSAIGGDPRVLAERAADELGCESTARLVAALGAAFQAADQLYLNDSQES